MSLQAPFPWFGGKRRAAELIWSRLGQVPNYVEPFAGSLATLLERPGEPGIETVNDLDGLLVNFWRAVAFDPKQTAHYANWPVTELDKTARHLALVTAKADLTAKLEVDPDFYDPKLAGWWVWGIATYIGDGWCSGNGPWVKVGDRLVKADRDAGQGINKQLPHLGDAGRGINKQLPHMGGGKGVNWDALTSGGIEEWFSALAHRLRKVRVCCGSWERVLTPSVTTKHGLTGVLLDPPYAAEDAHNDVYGVEYCGNISAEVRGWAIANGNNPLLRIALCGYDGEHEMPAGWECVAWKARKGYQTDDTNSKRERIWFSPHCLRPTPSLFD